jgi:cholesterol oxidase
MLEQAVGLVAIEAMAGGFALGATDPAGGEKAGKARGTSMTMHNTIRIASVKELLADPDHQAVLDTVIDFAPLGDGIVASPGIFQVFRQSDDPSVKLMIYACGFTASGKRYYLEGTKYIHDGEPLHTLLDQATTLYTKLYAGDDARGPVVGAGVLSIGVLGVIELVASMRATGASSDEQAALAIAAFGAFFLGELWNSYVTHVGGALAARVIELTRTRAGHATPHAIVPRPRLAFPAGDLPDGATATVVVIGSGYGGGIAASRLARAGQKVVVLERGKEWRAGDFPTGPLAAASQLQIDTPRGRIGARTGLYDMRGNQEVDLVVGCGLGGGSLINAGVALEPSPDVFAGARWPQAIRDDQSTLLADGFARARAMLDPTPYPDHAPALPKLAALARAADAVGRACVRPPINVAFEARINAGGVAQAPCTLCGDCVSGCNYNAKTTVDMTFLPDAKAHGAELYTEVTVRWIEAADGKYRVVWRWTEADDDAALRTITADVVILAAGVLGSTEILLRSAQRGLPSSGRIGTDFSANGDFLSFAYNGNAKAHAVGAGTRSVAALGPIGPTIAGVIEPPPGQPLAEQYIIEEGAIPGAICDGLPIAFAVGAATVGVNTATSFEQRVGQTARALQSLIEGGGGAYVGAINNTLSLLTIGHDDASGTLQLEDDRVRVVWPDAGKQPIFQQMQKTCIGATAATQGIWVKDPAWTARGNYNLVTAHPLGGCPMADDASAGAVNPSGQLFSGPAGTAVHRGLYVADGSIIPTSLGVNPLLTISALAERAMTLLIRDRGWTES